MFETMNGGRELAIEMMDSYKNEPIHFPLADGITLKFLPIPAGRFRMGQRDGEANVEPVTEVDVPEFWMGETPVTQEQYRVMAEACLEELSAIEGNRGSEPSDFKDREDSPQRPVEMVNWHEARVVARWLMGKMHDAGTLPPGCVVDLPPEALWEYACRAGTETEYWNGDGGAALAEVGWYVENSGGQTHPVRAKDKPNGFYLQEMHGNVNEWCLDFFEAVRGRFRLPEGGAEAYDDLSRLVRAPANPDHVAWAALLTRISGGSLELLEEDFPVMSKLRDFANGLVIKRDISWGSRLESCDHAFTMSTWPSDRLGDAETLRNIFQNRVNSASNAGSPDHVLRGGSWRSTAENGRSAYRNRIEPTFRDRINGFRLCVFLGRSETR